MTTNYQEMIDRFSGYAEMYNQYRPAPPDDFSVVLTQLAGIEIPECVVDLGCGTGLSTRYWASRARQVIGIDPSEDMLQEAIRRNSAPNVPFRPGFGHETGLPNQCAEIVTCSDSLHWMEPESTFREITRLLRPGGLFAWLNNSDEPVITPWEADRAFALFLKQSQALDEARQVTQRVLRWRRTEYYQAFETHFRHVHAFQLHHAGSWNADQLVGWVLTLGHVQSLLKLDLSPKEIGLEALESEVVRVMGKGEYPWYWSAEIRVGVL